MYSAKVKSWLAFPLLDDAVVVEQLSQILGGEKAINRILNRIKKMKYRVIIVSLPEEILHVLLCRVIGLGMTWPNYVGVIVNSDGGRFYEKNPCLDQVT